MATRPHTRPDFRPFSQKRGASTRACSRQRDGEGSKLEATRNDYFAATFPSVPGLNFRYTPSMFEAKADQKRLQPYGISVLAGGLSTRMRRDKTQLRLGSRTLLSHIRRTAQEVGLPVRIIRRDLVPRCGPLGGIFTALKTSHAEAELFLACDMPFVSPKLLAKLLATFEKRRCAVFAETGGQAGFPFLIPCSALPIVEAQILKAELSLQRLASALQAHRIRPAGVQATQLFNVNTPEDFQAARLRWGKRLPCKKATPKNASKTRL